MHGAFLRRRDGWLRWLSPALRRVHEYVLADELHQVVLRTSRRLDASHEGVADGALRVLLCGPPHHSKAILIQEEERRRMIIIVEANPHAIIFAVHRPRFLIHQKCLLRF